MSIPNFKLKELRYEHKLKQVDMAEKLNWSVTTYIRKENGESEFTESEMVEICKVFNKKPEDIFFKNKLTKEANGKA